MIKIGIRKNLIYPTIFSISSLLRDIQFIFIENRIENIGLLLSLNVSLAEALSGFIFYRFHINFLKQGKKEETNSTIMGIKLIKPKKKKIKNPDSNLIIFIYIFIAGLFDFSFFDLNVFFSPSNSHNYSSKIYISPSLNIRLRAILTFYSAILSYILLKIPIYKHQKCSLIVLGFCLISFLIIEISFLYNVENVLIFFLCILSRLVSQIFFCYVDIIEKYLFEYDYVNPYQMLMLEGIFGTILTIIFFIIYNPFKGISESYSESKTKIGFVLVLIFYNILFFVLSGIKNIYRVMTNKVYNPTTKNLADVVFDPILLIIFYYYKNDYKDKDKKIDKRGLIFALNLIISIIMVFSCCVYNEFFVLFCCDLEHNTHRQISSRSTSISENRLELMPEDGNDSDDDEENNK